MAVARQQYSKHISVAMNKYARIEELLEAVFSMLSMLRLHNKDAGEDQQQFT
jgi:ribosome-interacting GTPase 1